VLDELVQSRPNMKAAKRLLTGLMKKLSMVPKRIITVKLPSYGTARRQFMPRGEHWQHRGFSIRPGAITHLRSVWLHNMTAPRAHASLRNQRDGSSAIGSEE
jgi:transposase-like protein